MLVNNTSTMEYLGVDLLMSLGLEIDGGKFRSVKYICAFISINVLSQTSLTSIQKPLFFFLYVDKTKLSSFGTEKGYPAIARIGNFPTDIRNGRGVGGGRIVGWLPIVRLITFIKICIYN